MNWRQISEYINLFLEFALVVRLFSLRLHSVYRIFSVFLAVDFIGSVLAIVRAGGHLLWLDYRLLWVVTQAALWVFSLWMVYALLEAILENLPGILKFSKRLLNLTFIFAPIVGLLLARPEHVLANVAQRSDPFDKLINIAVPIDAVIGIVALLALVVILLFFLWFPVKTSRNLAAFSIGYIVYFATRATLSAAGNLSSGEVLQLMSTVLLLTASACFAFLTLYLTKQGETLPVRIGHAWKPVDQQKMIGQLEAINAALLRSARR